MTAPRDGDFQALISEIHYGSAAVTDGVNDLINGIDAALGVLAPTASDVWIDQLRRSHQVFTALLSVALSYTGDPDHLRAVGATWADDIGGGASRLAAFTTLNGVRVDDHWTGTAADAYRNTLLPQTNALTALKTTGDELDAVLNDLANGINEFWSAVAGAVIALVVALVAAVGTAPVTGGAVGVAALTACGGLLNSARAALVQILNDTSSRSAEIQRRLSNDAAFAAGAWPRATVPISNDAAITDGDDTDWHLR